MNKLAAVFVWPILVAVGWVFTRLSERYEVALDGIDFDFDEDDV